MLAVLLCKSPNMAVCNLLRMFFPGTKCLFKEIFFEVTSFFCLHLKAWFSLRKIYFLIIKCYIFIDWRELVEFRGCFHRKYFKILNLDCSCVNGITMISDIIAGRVGQ